MAGNEVVAELGTENENAENVSLAIRTRARVPHFDLQDKDKYHVMRCQLKII